MYGAVKSIHAALQIGEGDNVLDEYFDSSISNWTKVPDKEYGKLVQKLSSFHRLDIPKRWVSEQSTILDSWGNRFEIWYKSNGDIFNFLVISIGPDGESGTEDDILSLDNVDNHPSQNTLK